MNNELIEPLTYAQQNRESSLKVLKAVRHLVITMNEVYRDFWNRDPQKIVDSLNENIPLSLERFTSNTVLGTVGNDRMAAAGQSERVAVTMPEGFSFDTTNNLFVYTAPVVVEPEPIVDPEPEI
jgi:hypothetical protein